MRSKSNSLKRSLRLLLRVLANIIFLVVALSVLAISFVAVFVPLALIATTLLTTAAVLALFVTDRLVQTFYKAFKSWFESIFDYKPEQKVLLESRSDRLVFTILAPVFGLSMAFVAASFVAVSLASTAAFSVLNVFESIFIHEDKAAFGKRNQKTDRTPKNLAREMQLAAHDLGKNPAVRNDPVVPTSRGILHQFNSQTATQIQVAIVGSGLPVRSDLPAADVQDVSERFTAGSLNYDVPAEPSADAISQDGSEEFTEGSPNHDVPAELSADATSEDKVPEVPTTRCTWRRN